MLPSYKLILIDKGAAAAGRRSFWNGEGIELAKKVLSTRNMLIHDVHAIGDGFFKTLLLGMHGDDGAHLTLRKDVAKWIDGQVQLGKRPWVAGIKRDQESRAEKQAALMAKNVPKHKWRSNVKERDLAKEYTYIEDVEILAVQDYAKLTIVVHKVVNGQYVEQRTRSDDPESLGWPEVHCIYYNHHFAPLLRVGDDGLCYPQLAPSERIEQLLEGERRYLDEEGYEMGYPCIVRTLPVKRESEPTQPPPLPSPSPLPPPPPPPPPPHSHAHTRQVPSPPQLQASHPPGPRQQQSPPPPPPPNSRAFKRQASPPISLRKSERTGKKIPARYIDANVYEALSVSIKFQFLQFLQLFLCSFLPPFHLVYFISFLK